MVTLLEPEGTEVGNQLAAVPQSELKAPVQVCAETVEEKKRKITTSRVARVCFL